MTTPKITKRIARKVLETVDAGLVSGLGSPEPGKMCVEAAVCYALGLPHGDNPTCVSPALRALKIALNDAAWSSDKARTKGMRKLALLQLGSAGFLDDVDFSRRVAEMTIKKILPPLFNDLAKLIPSHAPELLAAGKRCKAEGTEAAAYAAAEAAAYAANAANAAYAAARAAANAANAANAAANAANAANAARAAANAAYAAANAAYAAANAAAYAASDKILRLFAKEVEKILIAMKVPGVKWLELIA